MEKKTIKPVILFDGKCNLCSKTVQFVIKHDRLSKFQFGSLQSEVGKKLAKQFNLNTSNLKTFILIDSNQAFVKSTAALKVARKLDGLWKTMYIFIVVPRFIRDFIYNFISRNRYDWFGKRNECWLPDEKYKSRFIEDF